MMLVERCPTGKQLSISGGLWLLCLANPLTGQRAGDPLPLGKSQMPNSGFQRQMAAAQLEIVAAQSQQGQRQLQQGQLQLQQSQLQLQQGQLLMQLRQQLASIPEEVAERLRLRSTN